MFIKSKVFKIMNSTDLKCVTILSLQYNITKA